MNEPRYRQVLLVEDEPVLRRIIARNLAGRGVRVAEADSCGAAIAAALRSRPDLILLDINLPDKTGWDVLRGLRERGVDVPTIVVSAVRVNPARLAEFRPLAYLPKPFPLEALLALVLGTEERSTSSTSRAWPTLLRASPASKSPSACPTGCSTRPTRSSWSTCRPTRSASACATATSTRPSGPTRRSSSSSARAT